MIIDLILDRKDGIPYNPKKFYNEILEYEQNFFPGFPISGALDYGENEDVKRELKKYIIEQEYNPQINDFIDSVDWI